MADSRGLGSLPRGGYARLAGASHYGFGIYKNVKLKKRVTYYDSR